jgi:hypothetical protein
MLDDVSPSERVVRVGPVQLNVLTLVSVLLVWAVLSVTVSIFYFGYGAHSWQTRSASVSNCELCTCFHQNGCWDGRFKGSFPTNGYKSMWFNMDAGMPFILLNFIVYTVLALEMSKV